MATSGADVPTRHGGGADVALVVLRGGFGERESGERIVFDGLGLWGMHVGNSQYVDPPHTGDVVKIMSLVRSMGSALGVIQPKAALLATPTCRMVMGIWI